MVKKDLWSGYDLRVAGKVGCSEAKNERLL